MALLVEEIAELERPRNPTPTTAASTSRDADFSGGAIPKKGSKYDELRGRVRHVSAGDNSL